MATSPHQYLQAAAAQVHIDDLIRRAETHRVRERAAGRTPRGARRWRVLLSRR
jgi:hypothetical protein